MKRNCPLVLKCVLLGLYSLFFVVGKAQGESELPPRIKNIRVMDPLKYPGKAIRKKMDGIVNVEIEVDERGDYVAHNIVESSNEIFSEAVDPFISQLLFYPAEKGEAYVGGIAYLTVQFEVLSRVPIKTDITFRFLSPSLNR